jgi:hypothetical protein
MLAFLLGESGFNILDEVWLCEVSEDYLLPLRLLPKIEPIPPIFCAILFLVICIKS